VAEPWEDKHVLVAVPADEEPGVSSVKGKCGMCEQEVWLSPASDTFLRAHPGEVFVVCMPCAPGLVELRGMPESVEMVPGQVGELRRAGMSDEDIAGVMKYAEVYLETEKGKRQAK
jgi:hypothetical protein